MNPKPLRVLLVEDNADDAELVLREFRRGGYEVSFRRVETAPQMEEALSAESWDAVISDYSLPSFNAFDALAVLQRSGKDLPFILVSGIVGEDIAVSMMKAGAHDYLLKNNLKRIVASLERELKDAEARRARRQAEESLRLSKEQLESTLRALPDLMFVVGRDGRILDYRAPTPGRLYRPPDKFLGKTVPEILPADAAEAVMAAIRAAACDGYHVGASYALEMDGQVQWFELSIAATGTPEQADLRLVVLIRDITERKRLEQQIVQHEKLASLGELAAGIAHEINQPLSGISMGLDNMAMKLAKGDLAADYARSKIQSLQQYVERITRIVEHVRVFSRQQASDSREPFSVNQAVRNALMLVRKQYETHGIAITLALDKHLPEVNGNLYEFEQIVLNLLTNAKAAVLDRARARPGKSFQKEITIRSLVRDVTVSLEIEDNGIGIAADDLAKVFDPFFTTKAPDQGTGLGLSITYGLVHKMGGEVLIKSEVGRFTRVTVALPRG